MERVKNQKGFTLIELIVVIAILGILAAIAIPRLSGFQESARTKADLSTYNTIDRAISAAAADETLKAGTVVCTVTSGSSVFSGTAAADVPGEMAKLVESTPVFKKSTHQDMVLTWTINADGSITKPTYTE